ncbi:zinc transporter ZIP1-like isoform X2 [Planococcus citri]|uniref:zinc transporter ZIP1-like isoform X2 n=1 Tax=Planococcus citri TaxID=170843 RepID=UPI0031F953CF
MDSVEPSSTVAPVLTDDAAVESTKYAILAALFVTTFVSSLLPLRIVSSFRNALDADRRAKYGRIVSVLNCFAGGVFLSTAFLDLFPQVIQLMKKAVPQTTFPLAEFIIAFGFLSILTAEQIVIDCNEKTTDCRTPIERLQARNIQLEKETLTVVNQEENMQNQLTQVLQKEENRKLQTKFHALFLLTALCIHSFFEGLAVGLQENPEILIQISIAILIHKIPVAFSIGLNVVQCELKPSAVIQLDLWFSLMTPVGTAIGIFLKKLSPFQYFNLLNGVLTGISTGTFIFIIFIEILPKELKRGQARLLNLLFLLFGFSSICASVIYETRQ